MNEIDILKNYSAKLGKDTANYVPAVLANALVSILNISIFTRVFSPFSFGNYALIIATTDFITILLSQWVQQSVLRYLPKYRFENNVLLFKQTIFSLLMLLIIAAALISMILFPIIIICHFNIKLYLSCILIIMGGFIFNVLISYFQANMQSNKFMIYQISFVMIKISFSIIYIFLLDRNINGLIYSTTMSYWLVIIPMFKSIGINNTFIRNLKQINSNLIKTFVKYGTPMIGWFLGAQILGICDRFVIGLFAGAKQVGIFSPNYSLVSMGIGLFSSPLIMSSHPIIMNTWENTNEINTRKVIKIFSRFYMIASIIIFTIFLWNCKTFAMVFLGVKYREGYRIIPILLFGFIAWNMGLYGHKGLEIKEKTKIMFYNISICAVNNILLNLILVPKYGYIGSSIATAISYSLYPILTYFSSKKVFRWEIPWKSVRNVFASAIIVSCAVYIYEIIIKKYINSIVITIIEIPLIIIAYLIVLNIIGEIEKREIIIYLNILKTMLKKNRMKIINVERNKDAQ